MISDVIMDFVTGVGAVVVIVLAIVVVGYVVQRIERRWFNVTVTLPYAIAEGLVLAFSGTVVTMFLILLGHAVRGGGSL